MKKNVVLFYLALGILLWNNTCSSHPHIFITPRAHFAFSGAIFEFFSVRWYFDEMSTIDFAPTAATNSPLNALQQKTILTLEGFPRPTRLPAYCKVEIDNIPVNLSSPSAVSLAIEEGRLTYLFTFAVYQPVKKAVHIWFSDRSNYIAYLTSDGFYTTSQTKGIAPPLTFLIENRIEKIQITR